MIPPLLITIFKKIGIDVLSGNIQSKASMEECAGLWELARMAEAPWGLVAMRTHCHSNLKRQVKKWGSKSQVGSAALGKQPSPELQAEQCREGAGTPASLPSCPPISWYLPQTKLIQKTGSEGAKARPSSP